MQLTSKNVSSRKLWYPRVKALLERRSHPSCCLQVGVKEVIQDTLRTGGPLGFYRGLSSMVYFAAPKASIRFASFETVSGMLTGPNGEDKYGLGGAKGFVAGLGAGTMEAIFVTTPQETIKVRLINDAFRTDGPPQYKNFFHGVKSIVGEFGLGGIYRGVVPTVIKVSTVRFVVCGT